MAEIRIPLSRPISAHGKDYTHLVLREPTYDDYVACGGEPYSIGQSEDGNVFTIEKPEVIWAYAATCIVSPDTLLLDGQDWRVAREVRKAILGFFQAPAAGSAPSETSPTTSSSS
ncbi:phage tail assembly protein [Methylobacterium frigidaeris]|uniref:Uncharacterized protein n=1 Tax=Methylobacterium frigidaeris TaxID=2038277 RepID=A0AA37HHB7_9HYPH|nr:phage tail assembly protein [Methylobacterium frigidaeris]PIK74817.1 ArsR family transcriptional regulator [Methylobacterium frigidaeris]GJD65175.1 hypothetical protein MPEAHAMD_5362 [Methylobacterium frigidaeris]